LNFKKNEKVKTKRRMFIYKKEVFPTENDLVFVSRKVSFYKSVIHPFTKRLIRTKKGECFIEGYSNAKNPDSIDYGYPFSLSIHIDEDCRGFGYSKKMWKTMISNIKRECPSVSPEKMFFVDADASAGYWEHLGCIENRYGYDYNCKTRELEGLGYEKVITLRQLNKE
jgi:hypothetical protein